MSLQMVRKERFGQVYCDFFTDQKEIWLSRRQIGEALEYEEPTQSIKNIHHRHKQRLDRFSRMAQIDTPSGKQEAVLYNAKGVYEICRWSQQPKADYFYDWVYEMLEKIRSGNEVLMPRYMDAVRMVNQQVRMLVHAFEKTDEKITEIEEKVEHRITLDHGKQTQIQFAVKKRVISLLGGKQSENYKNHSKKYFAALHKDIKKRLLVPSYKDIKVKDYQNALGYIKNWIPEADIKEY